MKLQTIYFILACFAVAVMVFTCSCKAPEPLVNETTTNDVIKDVTKPEIVGFSPDSAAWRLLVECDSMGQLHIRAFEQEQGERIAAEVRVEELTNALAASEQRNQDNERSWQNKWKQWKNKQEQPTEASKSSLWLLDFKARADSLEKVIETQSREITRLQTEATKEPVKVVPPFYRWSTRACWTMIGVLVLFLVWKIAKFVYLRR